MATPNHAVDIDAVLRDIDAYPAPKGVSAETWATLKAELKRLLVARAGGSKTISIAPTGSQDAVTDLTAMSNGAGTQATLSWTEVLPGDYNNDGVVDIIDLQPVALYYGQSTDSGPNDGHKLVVGDSDPVIGIGDLQAIANNYAARLQGYQVWRGHWNGTSTDWEATPRPNPNVANPNWSADRPAPPPVSSRPTYTYQDDLTGVTDKANVRYKVVAFGDGAPGAQSNVAAMTLNPLADSPWPKFRGNMQNTGQSPYVGPQTNHVRWSYLMGLGTYASPVIGADGTIYIVSADGYLYALNPSDGSLKWKAQMGGGNSTPAISADGTIYVGGEDGYVHALNPIDGTVKWKRLLAPNGVDSSPAIGIDGTVFAGCGVSMSSTDTFFALSPSDGSIRWKLALGGEGVTSCPAIAADGTIYVGSVGSGNQSLYALNPTDGSVKWKYPMAPGSSPALGSDGTVYVGSSDGNVYALNPSDGSLRWAALAGGSVENSPGVAADGTIYVECSDSKIYALKPGDGSLKWTFNAVSWGTSSAAVGQDGTVFVGAGYLYALSPSGAELWHFNANGPIYSSPAIGADGALYLGGDFDPFLYAIGS